MVVLHNYDIIDKINRYLYKKFPNVLHNQAGGSPNNNVNNNVNNNMKLEIKQPILERQLAIKLSNQTIKSNKVKKLLDTQIGYFEASNDSNVFYFYKNMNILVRFIIVKHELKIDSITNIDYHRWKHSLSNILSSFDEYDIKNITNKLNYKEIIHNMNILLEKEDVLHNQAG
jgi:hypothetical protein